MNTVSPFIRISWERSLASLVDTDQPDPVFVERTAESVLERAALPVLTSLSDELSNEPACLILTDCNGVVLQRGGGDKTLLGALDAVNLAPGFRYSEQDVGTNGIGTALEMGAPILVDGNDHYTGNLRQFSCAGALITHPVTGALLGVIDISTMAENSNSLLLSFAKLAARRIQERILEEANELDGALLGGYYAACQHSGGPVIAVGEKVFMMNALAQQHFDATDQAALLDQTREAVGLVDPTTFLADLPSGITARMAYRPTFVGNTLAGGIIQIKDQQVNRSPPPRRDPALPGLAGASAVWRNVTQEVVDVVGKREWVVLQGEPGVGALALIRAAHQHVAPTGQLAVLDLESAGDHLAENARTELAAGSDLVIRHAHVLGETQLDELAELFQEIKDASVDRDPWIALTTQTDELDEQLDLHLLHFFPRTVLVPPLRHHLEDVPALVRLLLNRAGAPELVLSKAAMSQLMRLPWPGNVTHLKKTLCSLVRTRRSGIVEATDLPTECNATTRRKLSPLEILERDAVIDALTTHHGDKVAAAEALGMSRATIYRKIRDYGISS
ncbi:MAG: Fis family transcriptional regulator [Corynebacterium sp.]|uniref:sigma-54-dependent Fis family transcriptional regulator n=1 Tax=Corynebacterium sp. TaxID=1720 RepID=UPI0026488FD9|nr:helix-turn-helix domain-containing protein [Corynebacterium sp.]MDN5723354.1 Fis family transcriptional regulator [Corynebacterium sp.]